MRAALTVQFPQLLRRHDAEVGKQQLAHLLVDGDGTLVVPHGEQLLHQMAVEDFVIRLQSHCLAAQGNRSRQPVLGLQQGERLQNGLRVEIVEIRGDGDHPRLSGEFCEKIALVEIQRLQIVFQTDIFLCGGGSRPAKSLKFLHIKEKLHIRVPGVTAVPPDDERVSGRGIQLIEHGADAVEHGLERIERIGTSLFLSPQQIHKILLRDGPIAAVYHVCRSSQTFRERLSLSEIS